MEQETIAAIATPFGSGGIGIIRISGSKATAIAGELFQVAAFLFLLTSALAPLIRLSYGRMVIMALPYTITMTIAGLAALWYLG